MGTKRPADFYEQISGRVQDLSGRLDPVLVADQLATAIKQYSIHRPRPWAGDLVGSNDGAGGSNDLVIPDGVTVMDATTSKLLPAFYDGFSRLDRVEYPVDQIPELVLNDNVAYLYRKPTGLALRIASNKLKTTDKARMFYTTYHDAGSDDPTKDATTVPDVDFPAVCVLAASFVSQILAQSYSQGLDTTIGGDVVDGSRRAELFSARAKELRAEYDDHMGISEKSASASGSTGAKTSVGIEQDFVVLDAHLGTGFTPLTHPRRTYEDQ